MRKLFNFTNRGDTIVEVLICIGILSVIVVGAYLTANRSLIAERDTQEHAEALTLAQSQIEALEGLSIQGKPLQYNPSDLCLYVNGSGSINPITGTPGHYCYVPSNNLRTQPTTSQPVNAAIPYYYGILLTETTPQPLSIAGGNTITLITYEVQVSWPSLNGGNDRVQLYYRPN